jgi:hypothetical protein
LILIQLVKNYCGKKKMRKRPEDDDIVVSLYRLAWYVCLTMACLWWVFQHMGK